MKAKLYGYRRVDMVDSKDGRRVVGYTCYIGYQSAGVIGLEAKKQWVPEDIALSCGFRPEADCDLEVEFTPYGKLSSICNVEV